MNECAIVLDMDDTLYLERDYVMSGFRVVAEYVAGVATVESEAVYSFLRDDFTAGERGHAFDRLLTAFPAIGESVPVSELVETYRSHRPLIGLLEPDHLDVLASSEASLVLITDGPVESQQAKIAALGVDERIDFTILTDQWGVEFRKPHPRAFELVEESLGLSGRDLVYVADNPAKDFIAPNSLGWATARMRCAGQLHESVEAPGHEAAPDWEGPSIEAITSAWLERAW